MFDRTKSSAIRRALNLMLNGKYGTVEALHINSKQQSLNLELLLNGEAETISIEIGSYRIEEVLPDEPEIVLREFRISRQWMQELATDNLEGQRLAIPAKFKGVVKMLLT